jgi:serine/threonine-protein kinase
MKQLEHPNLVRFVDVRVARKSAYIVMELFRSVNLKALIRSDLHGTHLRLKRTMECVTQALAYMHEKKWIHKDVKPDNILVTKAGEVRVIDFSLASRKSSSVGRMVTRKKSIAIQGTRTYIAPELVRREKLTHSADIYSLGVVFYEALTGRPPFMGANPNDLLMAHVREHPDVPSSYHPNISPEADALAMRLLSKKPQDRPESMQALFAELRSLRFFKQDPEVFKKERDAKEKEKLDTGVDQRLDSRADAARTERFGYQPMKPQPAKPAPAIKERETSAPKPVPQPAPTFVPPQPMPWMQPMPQPMMPPPMPHQMPVPPPLVGGAYHPGYPPQVPPGMMPPQQYPLPPVPAQPPVPQPAPPHSQQPAPQQQPAPAQRPPAPPAKPQKEQDLDTPDNLDWLNVS